MDGGTAQGEALGAPCWPHPAFERGTLAMPGEERDYLETQTHLHTPKKPFPSPFDSSKREGGQPGGEAGAAAASRTWQVELQLSVAHVGVAAPGAVLLHHVRAAVLQQVSGEAAPVLDDPPVLPPLADEAHLARAVGHAAVRHVARAQQLVCGHEDSTRCTTGLGCPVRGQPPPVLGMLVALGSTGSMLKTLEAGWDHQEAAEGMRGENASVPWAGTTNWAARARSAQPGGRIPPMEPREFWNLSFGLWGCCVLGSRHRMCSPSPRDQGAAALPPPDLALPFGAENIPPGISKFSTRAARRTVARGQTDGRPAAAPHGPMLVACAWWRGLGTIPGAPWGLHVPPAQSRDDPSLDPPRVPPVLSGDHEQLLAAPHHQQHLPGATSCSRLF